MSSIINADTSNGLKLTSDTSGVLQLQSGGTTIMTISSTGVSTQVGAPAFSAYGSALVSSSKDTFTKITYDTEDFDTNNNFASSRFTPTVAGYYQITATIVESGQTSSGFFASIFKNGSRYCDGASVLPTSDMGTMVSAIVYCNGSTDYIEIYGYQGGANGIGIGSNNYLRKFCGALIRSA